MRFWAFQVKESGDSSEKKYIFTRGILFRSDYNQHLISKNKYVIISKYLVIKSEKHCLVSIKYAYYISRDK